MVGEVTEGVIRWPYIQLFAGLSHISKVHLALISHLAKSRFLRKIPEFNKKKIVFLFKICKLTFQSRKFHLKTVTVNLKCVKPHIKHQILFKICKIHLKLKLKPNRRPDKNKSKKIYISMYYKFNFDPQVIGIFIVIKKIIVSPLKIRLYKNKL